MGLTDKGILVADDGVGASYHLVGHAKVEIESRLVLVEPEEAQCYRGGRGLAVVDGRSPGRSAPVAPDVRPIRLRDLERAVRATCRRERHEFPEREAVERQLQFEKGVLSCVYIIGQRYTLYYSLLVYLYPHVCSALIWTLGEDEARTNYSFRGS